MALGVGLCRLERALRMRVDSCQRVIHDVSERLRREDINPRITAQLQRLDELLSLIDHQAVTDYDLSRIEGATNQLMDELRLLFCHQGLGCIYHDTSH